MNKKKKPLSRQVSFRVDDIEYSLLHDKMEDAGYGSMAMFVLSLIHI